jgi:hypothetical protein
MTVTKQKMVSQDFLKELLVHISRQKDVKVNKTGFTLSAYDFKTWSETFSPARKQSKAVAVCACDCQDPQFT